MPECESRDVSQFIYAELSTTSVCLCVPRQAIQTLWALLTDGDHHDDSDYNDAIIKTTRSTITFGANNPKLATRINQWHWHQTIVVIEKGVTNLSGMVVMMMVLLEEVCSCDGLWQVLLKMLCVHAGPDTAQVPIACTPASTQSLHLPLAFHHSRRQSSIAQRPHMAMQSFKSKTTPRAMHCWDL